MATIDNDESSVLISPSLALEINEGDSPEMAATFSYQLVRTGDTDKELTVSWAVKPREGAENQVDGEDFSDGVLPTGEVTFAPGENGQDTPIGFSFQANPDSNAEFNEEFQVELSLPPEASAGTTLELPKVFGTILNDDIGLLTISPPSLSLEEGDSEETTPFTFTVTRSEDVTGTATVKYILTNIGTNKSDFVPEQVFEDTLEFEDGETEKSIAINVAGDYEFEGNETFEVSLTEPSPNVSIDTQQATAIGEIQNDDKQVSVSLTTGSELNEGNPSSETPTQFVFNVTRSGTADAALAVQWELMGTGSDPLDLNNDLVNGQLTSGTVNFASGVTEQMVTVEIMGDLEIEIDESLSVKLSNPDNAILVDESAPGTIETDDFLPELTFDSDSFLVEAVEGDEDTTFTFSVQRTGKILSNPTTVEWEVRTGGIGPWDAKESDFVGDTFPKGTLMFEPNSESGQDIANIEVDIKGDTTVEEDEFFIVFLSNAVGGTFIDDPDDDSTQVLNKALGIIDDDDSPVQVFVSPPDPQTQLEGNGDSTEFVFTISTATGNNVNELVSVDWTITGIDDGPADGADFVPGTLFSGTVDFEPGGDQQIEIPFFVQGDTDPEISEGFRLMLTEVRGNAKIQDGGGSADAFISNDDFAPDLSIEPGPVENDEGNSGTTPFTFMVTRTGTDEDLNETTTVDWKVTPNSDTVTVDDFVSDIFPSGTLEFTADSPNTQEIMIEVQGDTEFEDNEGFTVTLSNQENAIIIQGTATGTIENDDPIPPDLSIGDDVSIAEGNEGSTLFTFTVKRTGNNLSQASTFLSSILGLCHFIL